MSLFGLEREYISCPFCDEGIIEYLFKPRLTTRRQVRSAVAKGLSWKKSKAEYIWVTEKCPKCGKSIKEIEKKLREDGII